MSRRFLRVGEVTLTEFNTEDYTIDFVKEDGKRVVVRHYEFTCETRTPNGVTVTLTGTASSRAEAIAKVQQAAREMASLRYRDPDT